MHRRYLFITILFFLTVSGFENLAQTNNSRIKANIILLPETMVSGGIYDVVISIHNTSNSAWSSDSLELKFKGKFGIKRQADKRIISPGSKANIVFKVFAPVEEDKYIFEMTLYDKKRELLQTKKQISVIQKAL